ncbi:MAG TPA: aminotransferase class III-fold pyridoxal phosphate-dependent enzyme [Candidatus Dormibacteraeota bacterium]|nr:aminotransferase class III-fold pyridoxal phosphate-dependent enzyme [Candidatus Dormibacteraeota bacterium]
MATTVPQSDLTNRASLGGTSEEWRARDRRSVASVWSRYTDLVISSAEGSFLIDVEGRRYLDFACGIAVTSLGHRHPDVTAAVHRQLDRYWHTSIVTQSVVMTEAAERVAAICPEPLDVVFFANSGAEVVDGALKLARRSTGRQGIISFRGAFHGRTFGALSVTTSKALYRAKYGPLVPGVQVSPYPYCFRVCDHAPGDPCPIAAGEELERLFHQVMPASEVAAILVEPIQGEGGYVVPPPGFLATLRRICDQHGILLICDEIQSGVARTGRWLAVDHEQVVPDIVTLAKALGSGLPVGAIVASHQLMDRWESGSHGSTFGGNPVVGAAVIATLQVIERDHLMERATNLGETIRARIEGWQRAGQGPSDLRGRGALIGLEFLDQEGRPDANRVSQIKHLALDQGLVLLSCGIDDNVIRLLPPLTVSDAELAQGLDILGAAVLESGMAG